MAANPGAKTDQSTSATVREVWSSSSARWRTVTARAGSRARKPLRCRASASAAAMLGARPGAPGDGGGLEAAGAALFGESVEEGVGGGVRGTRAAAPDTGDGREEDERVEVAVAEEFVEVGGASDLGGHDLGEFGGSEVGEEGRAGGARGVDDSGEVREGRDDVGEGVAVGNVAGDGHDAVAEGGGVAARIRGARQVART